MQRIDRYDRLSILGAGPEIAFALFAFMAFFLTIGQPETMVPEDFDSQRAHGKYSMAFSPDVVIQSLALEPGRLLSEGKPDVAVTKAIDLATKKPFDIASNICAGNVLCNTDNQEEGLRILKRAVALAPRSRYVRMNLAEKLADAKRFDEAATQFQLIITGYPHWEQPHIDLANIYLSTDRPSEAAAELKVALESDINNGELRKTRALALALAGQGRKGLEEYIRGDDDAVTFFGMPPDIKQAIATWNGLDRALFQCRRELDNNPDETATKVRLARLLLYSGHPAEAKTMLMDAKKKVPSNLDIHRNLAVVLHKLGDENNALNEFVISVNLQKAKEKAKQEEEE